MPLNSSSNVLNPYPFLGCPEPVCWPRGFPLENILDVENVNLMCNNDMKTNFGVLQSLADHEPDVDAIYRLTRGTPFSFNKNEVRTTICFIDVYHILCFLKLIHRLLTAFLHCRLEYSLPVMHKQHCISKLPFLLYICP